MRLLFEFPLSFTQPLSLVTPVFLLIGPTRFHAAAVTMIRSMKGWPQSSVSKTVAHGQVEIIIALKLAKASMTFGATKKIYPSGDPQLVCTAIVQFWIEW